MTDDHSALLTLLAELHDTTESDRIRRITEDALQKLINAEVGAVIGAGPYERTAERLAHGNGTRPKTFSTTAGDLNLRIPKLRTGSFYPSLLERRRRIDIAPSSPWWPRRSPPPRIQDQERRPQLSQLGGAVEVDVTDDGYDVDRVVEVVLEAKTHVSPVATRREAT